MKLSLVIPCYNEEGNVGPFYEAASAALTALPSEITEYELVFVNDGSKDATRQRLRALFEAHADTVRVVNFSRNFGKEAAVLAGLRHAGGDFVTVIDADLQQRPEIAVDMVRHLLENPDCDAVAAYQQERIEGHFLSWCKRLFYKIINKACKTEFHQGASDFRTLRRKVVDAILSLPEYFRFSKGIFSWVGFDTYYMPYTAEERHAGQTKWNFFKLLRYALDGFISFTTFPLRISTWIGFILSLFSIVYMIVVVIRKLFFLIDIPGYPTIVVLILLIGGIQFLMLGIMGEYIAKDYIQGKRRPVYIEKDCWEQQEQEEA